MNKVSISFKDSKDKVILERRLTSLPLRENAVISKSVEFFNDPEPCMIHRSAVMKRLYMEINDFLSASLQRGEKQLVWDHIPIYLRTYIHEPDNTMTLSIKR